MAPRKQQELLPLRVLHLFSNSKWTGPAEPALNLCVALRSRGVNVDFACAPDAGNAVNMVVEMARKRGLNPLLGFHLKKHRHPVKNAQDKRRLDVYLESEKYDLIHCHLDNDHGIALQPAIAHGIPLLRTSYYGQGFPDRWRYRRLLASTDFLVESSRSAWTTDAARFSFPEERTAVVPGAVDVHRFSPRSGGTARSLWQVPPDAFVVGIVARMQKHRHYEDLFAGFKLLLERFPRARLLVVGRGTRQEEVGYAPVRRLQLEEQVHFTGYLSGADYVNALASFDAGVFLTPGSDETCRAAREIMAMGVPLVAADRGMLPEIVAHGRDGFVFDGAAQSLALYLARLAEDAVLRKEMGEAARNRALTTYSLEAQAAAIEATYETALRAGKRTVYRGKRWTGTAS